MQARPYRVRCTLVQVRVGYCAESGRVETRRVAKHHMRAHKLALVPDDPGCFFSCGEDGIVMHCDIRCRDSVAARPLLTCRRSRKQVLTLLPGCLLALLHSFTAPCNICL